MTQLRGTEPKINIIAAAQIVRNGCLFIGVIAAVRFFAFPSALTLAFAWAELAAEPLKIVASLFIFAGSDLMLALFVLGITCLVIRPRISEEAVHPLERSNERYPVLCGLRKSVQFGALLAVAFFLTRLGLLGMVRFSSNLWLTSVTAMVSQLLFGVAGVWHFAALCRRASDLIPPPEDDFDEQDPF